MALTTAGLEHMVQALLGEVVDAFDGINSHVGAGDGTAAFSISQTDLQASVNVLRKLVEAGFPQRSGSSVVFEAIFSNGEANFDWEEWGIFNASTGGVMLLREVESLGTKTSAQSWVLSATIQFTAA